MTSHNAVIEDDRQKYKEEAAKKKQERDAKKAEKAVNEATDAVVDVGKKAWKKTKEFFQSL